MMRVVIRVIRAAVGVAFVLALSAGSVRAQTTLKTELARAAGFRPENKFKGSLVEVASYIGSGTFYTSGYNNPYASLALYARPIYDLGTPFALTLNARIYVERELTTPDNPNNRRLYVYDPWVWLSASNLHTFERSKIRIGGIARVIIPLSPESRYQNMLFGVGGGPSVNRVFEFGDTSTPGRKWTLVTTYALASYKYVQTSVYRGSGPSDAASACRAPGTAYAGGGAGEPGSAASDRCGGPHNPNFSISNVFLLNLSHAKWFGGVSLLITNTFNYSFPDDPLSPQASTPTGRSDMTWGIINFGRQITDRFSVLVGISSLQPALDSRYRYPRFPFFDLSGGANANNFTQLLFAVDGVL
jgi:hypothetical protein